VETLLIPGATASMNSFAASPDFVGVDGGGLPNEAASKSFHSCLNWFCQVGLNHFTKARIVWG
jgi:hypothetical protein